MKQQQLFGWIVVTTTQQQQQRFKFILQCQQQQQQRRCCYWRYNSRSTIISNNNRLYYSSKYQRHRCYFQSTTTGATRATKTSLSLSAASSSSVTTTTTTTTTKNITRLGISLELPTSPEHIQLQQEQQQQSMNTNFGDDDVSSSLSSSESLPSMIQYYQQMIQASILNHNNNTVCNIIEIDHSQQFQQQQQQQQSDSDISTSTTTIITAETAFVQAYDSIFRNYYNTNDDDVLLSKQQLDDDIDNNNNNINNNNTSTRIPPITILWKIGYRYHDLKSSIPMHDFTKNDVIIQNESIIGASSSSLSSKIIHNISSDYIHHVLRGGNSNSSSTTATRFQSESSSESSESSTIFNSIALSPLVQLKQNYYNAITLIVMLHDPEIQYSRLLQNNNNNNNFNILQQQQQRQKQQDLIEKLLYDSCTTLQQYCRNEPISTSSTSTTNSNNKNIQYPLIDGYGIVSNGLSLPEHHPLHVSYETICTVSQRVYDDDSNNRNNTNTNGTKIIVPPKLYAIQLPINALEYNISLYVAKQIQHKKKKLIEQQQTEMNYLSNVKVIAMRPLICYPNGGILTTTTSTNSHRGSYSSSSKEKHHNQDDDDEAIVSSILQQASQYPFILKDYLINIDNDTYPPITTMTNTTTSTTPTKTAPSSPSKMVWTNDMNQPPMSYTIAYQRILQLLDGYEIYERQAERQLEAKKMNPLQQSNIDNMNDNYHNDYLTEEERETLYGCQVLQRMIQNCHTILPNVRCIQMYDLLLSQYIVPIIYNKFAGLDDDTTNILKDYFINYRKAIQYYVAYNIRQLLIHGESGIVDGTNNNNNNSSNNDNSSNTFDENRIQRQQSEQQQQQFLVPPTYNTINELPQSKRLQEFGIELILNQQQQLDDNGHNSNNNNNNENDNHQKHYVFDTILVGMTNVTDIYDILPIGAHNHNFLSIQLKK